MMWLLTTICLAPGLSRVSMDGSEPPKGDALLKKSSDITLTSDDGDDLPFFPQTLGGGWLVPESITQPELEAWTPQITIEAPETLWTAVQRVRYQGQSRVDCIDVFRSTNCGKEWAYQFSIVNGNGGYLSDPVIAMDQRSSPRRVYIAFASQWYFWRWHRGLECASFDPENPFGTFKSAWVELNYYEEVGTPALAVERGYGTNRVYCGWNAWNWGYLFYGLRFKASSDMGASWGEYLYTDDSEGYVGYLAGDTRDNTCPLVFFVFNENTDDQDPDRCHQAHFLFSTDRGKSWKDLVYTCTDGYIYQSSAAAALGGKSVIWAIESGDTTQHDLCMKYSTDNGETWDWYWYEKGEAVDTRFPVVKPEGICGETDVSERYYFVAYRSNDPGSNMGNVLFKTALVDKIGSPSGWEISPGADSLVVEDVEAYGMEKQGWGQMDVQACRTGSGHFKPSVVWSHPGAGGSHSILFSTTVKPMYDGDDVNETGALAGDGLLLNTVNRGVLFFRTSPETAGRELKIYNAGGQLVKTGSLSEMVSLGPVAPGVYLYRVQGGLEGRFVVIR